MVSRTRKSESLSYIKQQYWPDNLRSLIEHDQTPNQAENGLVVGRAQAPTIDKVRPGLRSHQLSAFCIFVGKLAWGPSTRIALLMHVPAIGLVFGMKVSSMIHWPYTHVYAPCVGIVKPHRPTRIWTTKAGLIMVAKAHSPWAAILQQRWILPSLG